MIKVKKSAGRPPLFKDPIELENKIIDYFNNCPDTTPVYSKYGIKLYDKKELTITGLVLHCGFCDRKSFYTYELKPEFSHTIKKARTMIEKEYELLLRRGLGAGAIFALKNFGWKDENKSDAMDEKLEDLLEFTKSKSNQESRLEKFYN